MVRRFNRYELKYVLPFWRRNLIMTELEGYTVPDPHGGRSGYPLVSLYYDSPSLDFFWAKVEGIKFRRKLRLRIYPAGNIADTAAGMVEIKQRVDRTVQKRRLELPLPVAEGLCRGELDPDLLARLDDADAEVASEVVYLVKAMHLRPAAITAYHRIALVGTSYDSGLRVTFDHDLRGRVHALRVSESTANLRLVPSDWCVMEVKADDKVPDWITSLLARHGCRLRRVSKYCAAISKLSNNPATEMALSPLGTDWGEAQDASAFPPPGTDVVHLGPALAAHAAIRTDGASSQLAAKVRSDLVAGRSAPASVRDPKVLRKTVEVSDDE